MLDALLADQAASSGLSRRVPARRGQGANRKHNHHLEAVSTAFFARPGGVYAGETEIAYSNG
jgi:hypothetical protein